MDRLREAELFLLDMDGTLYLGDNVLPGAREFIRTLERTGKRWIYLTNNSSRGGRDYVPRLRQLGFPCTEEQVYTSGMATAAWLKKTYPDKAVFPVGTVRFLMELADYGITFTEEEPAAVVVGFDRELTYAKLEKAVHFRKERKTNEAIYRNQKPFLSKQLVPVADPRDAEAGNRNGDQKQ